MYLVRLHVCGDVGDLRIADLALIFLLAGVLPPVVPQELAQRGEGQTAVGAEERLPARGRVAQAVALHAVRLPRPEVAVHPRAVHPPVLPRPLLCWGCRRRSQSGTQNTSGS